MDKCVKDASLRLWGYSNTRVSNFKPDPDTIVRLSFKRYIDTYLTTMSKFHRVRHKVEQNLTKVMWRSCIRKRSV